MNLNLISKYLIYLRQSKHYTQEILSEELGISRQAISRWETANSLPDLDVLLKLSKLYDITINQILEPHIENTITVFEEIAAINQNKLKSILMAFETIDIVKASMGTSPAVNILLEKLFPDIDFAKARECVGSVKIEDIETIHSQIVSMVNISK